MDMNLYDITVKDIKGRDVSLSEFKGKVLLIVNTATGCGFMLQYDALQALYKKFRDRGFEILDFPCNQHGRQAPGKEDEIADFCKTHFGVTFHQFAKIEVNGKDESPVYTFLKANKESVLGDSIKWNFTKFLIDGSGNVVARYAPTTKPEALESDIEKLLKEVA
jgi:glutathione peroxidase